MLSELIAEDKRRLSDLVRRFKPMCIFFLTLHVYIKEQQIAEFEKGSKKFQSYDIFLGLNEMSIRLEELEKQANKESKGRRDDMRRRVGKIL